MRVIKSEVMKYYLGLIKYRPDSKWFEIYKLIEAESVVEAENKLRKWADKSVQEKIVFITVTENL